MNLPLLRASSGLRLWAAATLLPALLATPVLRGQAAPQASQSSGPTPNQEVVELTAFEVAADQDNSYGALNSASITRFNV